jgi:lysophospholipase
MEPSQASDESRVLVIYTGALIFCIVMQDACAHGEKLGGTIGMLVGQKGYVPEPYFLTETLRSQNRFHDPLQGSLFSNAGSVQGFREWSGRSSPIADVVNLFPLLQDPQRRTLLVRSSRPIGHATLDPSPTPLQSRNQPRCTKVSENLYEAHLPTLVTPKSRVPGGNISKSIRYAILEVSPVNFFVIGGV